MHIALIVPGCFTENYGGAERQAELLARAMAAQGARVTIVAPCRLSDSAEVETDFGVSVTMRLRDYPNFGGRRMGSTLAWTARVFAWVRRRTDIDAVYVFHARLHALPGLVSRMALGKPLFIKLGGGGEVGDFKALESKKGGYGRLIARLIRAHADGFVANSREIVADLKGYGVPDDKIIEISNGVQAPTRDVFERLQAARTGRRFLYTGRIEPDKNVPVLVEALALCLARGCVAELTIVGAGSDLRTVAERASSLGIAEFVHLPGRQDDVQPYLTQNDFFLSASQAEGQSNSLLEAMAHGLIPVVAEASGVRDLVADGERGFVATTADPAELSRLMQRVMTLPEAGRGVMAAKAHRYIAGQFGIDEVARRTLEVMSTRVAASQND
ncbi:glycosyltransferase family 4 protein [Brevundimonas sp.]|uniref:glycosyltransferase family 4 protein n=1 Tax=Brevundimonas sp. TaxID=1871086 RepID=UPI003D0DC990